MKVNRLGALLLCLFAASEAYAAGTRLQGQVDRLVESELRASEAWGILAHLSDNIGPRLSGSPQAAEAVRWTTERFRQWGIMVRNERVMVPHWVRGEEKASLLSHFDQKIIVTALGGSVATPPDGLTADVIEVSSYEELDALGDSVRGKIVLFNKPMDRAKVQQGRAFEAYSEAVTFRGGGASRAAAKGAVASLIRSVASASLRTPHTGSVRYDSEQPSIPAGAITTEDADLIHRLLARGEKVVMRLVLTPQTLPEVESANVVAELAGRSSPEEIVLIGGHLDSWDLGTGAIDNGSGVAMVMEVMRLLKASGLRPRRTIRAVLFMNEENGLRGGRGYAEQHADELTFHVAAIESDAGTAAPVAFATTVGADDAERIRRMTVAIEKLGIYRFDYSAETGADTSPLVEKGVPGFGLVTDSRHYFDYHHSAADTLDKVDRHELTRDAAALAALTWALAETAERFTPAVKPTAE